MAYIIFTGKHAAGYSIGNQNPSRGNNFFLLEVGYNFN